MPWYAYAGLAAASWGLIYILNEALYRQVSFVVSMAISNIAVGIFTTILTLCSPAMRADLTLICHSPALIVIFTVSILSLLAAEIFIALSITAKNATLAALIEISSPIFIILFSSLLLHHSHLNFAVAAGGAFIIGGVALVIIYGDKA